MSLFNNAIIGASGQGGYQISRSVRLRQSASAYFSRTPASASNRTTWTWSGWVKRGLIPISTSANGSALFGAGTFGANAQFRAYLFDAGIGTNTACIYLQETVYGVSNQLVWYSTAVLRDPSGWYHVVVAIDTTQATAANRVKVYLNGVALTGTFQTTPAQNQALSINNTVGHSTGAAISASAFEYLDGYLTEINFIDGQALTPSSFGQTNSQTGVWQPIKYTGTYGTNGFYLNFSDNSNNTATTMGKDYSGNGNNWTPNNISVTAGVTYDSMLDVPTLYADGGNGRGNYAVLNVVQDSGALASGNLRFTGLAGSYSGRKSTIAIPSTGKWYWETNVTTQNGAIGSWFIVGMCTGSVALTAYTGQSANTISYGDRNDGRHLSNETTTVSTSATIDFSTGDVLQCAYDAGTGKFWFGKNNAWWDASVGTTGNPSAGTNQTLTAAAKEWFPYVQMNEANNTADINFGQRPFTYTPPTGFVALNTQNLPTPTILKGNQYFDATTYTGNGTTTTISSLNFQPDLVWQKNRSSIANHILVDSVRGGSLYLIPNSTGADASAPGYMTFNTNGESFTSSDIATNQNGQTYVAWQWNAGGSTVTNTSGSITSQVRANPTAGFSVVTYTGTGANATVGHGLGVAPKMVIVKQRTGTAQQWAIWHTALLGTEYLGFDTAAKNALANVWNSTTPTSSVFSIGPNGSSGANTINYVAYCFSAVAGYSAFGSYTGNGSTDGPFVFLGFRPRWVMIKRTDSAGFDWNIVDTSRNTYNVTTSRLWADLSNAEDSTDNVCDITSNGFKLRSTNTNTNASGGTYIYMAVAENPFKISLAR